MSSDKYNTDPTKDGLNDGRLIDTISKENKFRIPDRYFEKLPLKIQERIHRPERVSVFSIIQLLLRPSVSIPALTFIILAIVGSIYYLRQDPGKTVISHRSNTTNKRIEKTDAVVQDSVNIREQNKHTDITEEPILNPEPIPSAISTAKALELSTEEEQLIAEITTTDKINYIIDSDIDLDLIIDEL
jgi:hypothetical protein